MAALNDRNSYQPTGYRPVSQNLDNYPPSDNNFNWNQTGNQQQNMYSNNNFQPNNQHMKLPSASSGYLSNYGDNSHCMNIPNSQGQNPAPINSQLPNQNLTQMQNPNDWHNAQQQLQIMQLQLALQASMQQQQQPFNPNLINNTLISSYNPNRNSLAMNNLVYPNLNQNLVNLGYQNPANTNQNMMTQTSDQSLQTQQSITTTLAGSYDLPSDLPSAVPTQSSNTGSLTGSQTQSQNNSSNHQNENTSRQPSKSQNSSLKNTSNNSHNTTKSGSRTSSYKTHSRHSYKSKYKTRNSVGKWQKFRTPKKSGITKGPRYENIKNLKNMTPLQKNRLSRANSVENGSCKELNMTPQGKNFHPATKAHNIKASFCFGFVE